MTSSGFFDYDDMIAAAERETGCDDWGPDDVHTPLRVLVRSLNEEANLSEIGRVRAKSHIHTNLTARLRLINDRKLNPKIVEQEVHKPIFLTGSQRSGTSYLNALLVSDPINLGVYQWQLAAPSPPPNHPDFDHGPEIAYGQRLMESEGWLDPDIRDKHDFNALLAAEDTFVQEYSFISVAYPFFFYVPSYAEFLADADNTPAYRIEKMFLQALQYGVDRRQLVLKSPLHLSLLGDLFSVFPDARIVVNHRDPTRTLSSLLSLLDAHRRQFGCPVTHDRDFALILMEGIAGGYEDMMRRRQDPKVDAVFVDVNYVDLERDPIGQVQKIYDRFGLALDDPAKQAMGKYTAENRKGKHGKHRHTLDGTVLTVDEVRERFKTYLDAYEVPGETAT